MARIAVVYWSGTGHTEAMAEAVARGCGGELFTASAFAPEMVSAYDAIAFGCPSMGDEQLEESEFAPLFAACKPFLSASGLLCSAPMAGAMGNGCAPGKRNARPRGAELACDSVICQDEPDGDALTQCEALGHALK